jgi:hypothetical protein
MSMSIASRRSFLGGAGALALMTAGPARAAMAPDDKFDLVIKGGDVLDPSQGLRSRRYRHSLRLDRDAGAPMLDDSRSYIARMVRSLM